MLRLLPVPRWICPQAVSLCMQQRRHLRVRPRARPPPPTTSEADKRAPAETVTLTDGTTIQVQAERGHQGSAAGDEDAAPPPPTPTPTPRDIDHLVPSPQEPPRDSHTNSAKTPSALPKPPKTPSTLPKPPKTPPPTLPTGPHDYNWYYETTPPTALHTTHANTFFDTHGPRATLVRSIAHFRTLPETDVPEVAFIGRSNVGKSSLLNAVMGCNTRTLLARTSRTPGFTKTMNLYGIAPEPGVRIKPASPSGPSISTSTSTSTSGAPSLREKIVGPRGLVILDMPGYGSGSLTSWGVEILKYLQSRKSLRRVFVLIDAAHGVKDKDRSILASLRLAGVSHQVLLSKMDKLYVPPASAVKRLGKGGKVKSRGSVGALRECMRALLPEIKPPHGGAALGEILACSSETLVDGRRLGVEHVRFAVLKAVGLEGEERRGFTESRKKKKAVDLQA